MIKFSDIDFSIIPKEEKQALRVRRSIYALFGAAIHTWICLSLWWIDDFKVTLPEFVKIFSAIWVMHLSIFIIIRSGLNKNFQDPSLTVQMMLWALTCTMYTVYLARDLREILLMMNFLILVFGAFQLSQNAFLLVTLYGTGLLFLIVKFLTVYPNATFLQKDWVLFFSYTLISLGFFFVAVEINGLRRHLHDKNTKLSKALKIIESLSVTDELTGLKNRRYMLNVLENQRHLTERSRYGFSVCMFDIDYFKNINDSYGHPAGDTVLKRIGENTQNSIRNIDYLSRFGGEEFLVIFPLTNIEQGQKGAERIRESIESINFDDIAPNLKVTVSLGVTEYRQPEAIKDVLERVDSALYAAKHNGRNRVEVS